MVIGLNGWIHQYIHPDSLFSTSATRAVEREKYLHRFISCIWLWEGLEPFLKLIFSKMFGLLRSDGETSHSGCCRWFIDPYTHTHTLRLKFDVIHTIPKVERHQQLALIGFPFRITVFSFWFVSLPRWLLFVVSRQLMLCVCVFSPTAILFFLTYK